MMDWASVGEWIKGNAGPGASLIGSLLTGNVHGAIAAGVSMVSGATGHADPAKALESLQSDPATIIRLKEIAAQEATGIRDHLRLMEEARLKDAQAEHHETQETVRAGDRAEDKFVRWTRPGQSWVSLIAAITYAFNSATPNWEVLSLLLALPWAYAGLRQIGKGIDTWKGKGAA
jgi:hypothetical protein